MGEKQLRPALDLAVPPADAVEAEGYAELYQQLEKIHAAISGQRMSAPDFAAWDERTKSLLRPQEVARLEKPLRPHIPNEDDTVQYARNLHLTKILWARKGLEKLISDTGY